MQNMVISVQTLSPCRINTIYLIYILQNASTKTQHYKLPDKGFSAGLIVELYWLRLTFGVSNKLAAENTTSKTYSLYVTVSRTQDTSAPSEMFSPAITWNKLKREIKEFVIAYSMVNSLIFYVSLFL